MNERKNLLLCLTAWILFFTLRAGGQVIVSSHLSEAYHQAQFNALLESGFQYWDKGHLIAFALQGEIETNPNRAAVILYNKNGQIDREAVVWFEGANTVTISDAALSKSGQLVVSGATVDPKGTIATYIAEIGPDNRVKRAIQTSPFSPRFVCATGDGTVWAYGQDRDDHLANVSNSLRLRQYSFEKGQLRAMLDTSTLNSEGWALSRGRYPGDISLRCNAKTVTLFNGRSSELIEFDLQSKTMKITKVTPLPEPPEFELLGFALTESGEIFTSFLDRTQKPQKPALSGLLHLIRDNPDGTAKWVPVEGTVGPYLHGSLIQRLLGADGDDLVYTNLKDGRMYWSRQSGKIAAAQ